MYERILNFPLSLRSTRVFFSMCFKSNFRLKQACFASSQCSTNEEPVEVRDRHQLYRMPWAYKEISAHISLKEWFALLESLHKQQWTSFLCCDDYTNPALWLFASSSLSSLMVRGRERKEREERGRKRREISWESRREREREMGWGHS